MIDFINKTLLETNAGVAAALDVAIKATILLALAFSVHAGLLRRRSLARSALWEATLVGLILLPLPATTFPRLRVAILPADRTTTIVRPLPATPGSFPANVDLVDKSAETTAVEPIATSAPDYSRAPELVRVPTARDPLDHKLGGPAVAVFIYLGVASLLAIRLGASLAAARRLVARCVAIDDPAWKHAAECTRARLGITRSMALLASDRVSVPLTLGWLRPAIILPEAMPGTAAPVTIDMVILHELAHVRRGDFIWNVVCKLVQLIYWPLPLVWPVGRVVSAVREQACDDLCVHGMGGAAAYRSSLLEVASALLVRPDLSLGLAVVRATNLSRRLAWIDVSRGKPRCLLGLRARLGVTLSVMLFGGVLGSIELGHQAVSAEQRNDAGVKEAPARLGQPAAIEVVVVGKDSGKRLPGATVRFSIDFGTSVRKADRDGVARFDLMKRTFQDALSFDVWAEGYVQQRFFFAENDARYPKIPEHLTVDLLPGEETLGGKVTDEQGRPIAGVSVIIWGYLGEKKDKHELAYMVDATTDERGQWRCRCFRSMTFAYLYLSHPDYLSDGDAHPREHGQPGARGKRGRDDPPAIDQPLAGLRDFSDVQVMTTGASLAGKVTDEHDKPITGAEVGWLEASGRNTFHDAMPVTFTKADGRFRFPHVRPGKLTIQVKAKGYPPELKPLDDIDMAGHLTVKLGPPRRLSGRVIDSGGTGIPGVFVNIDTWRRFRSLGVFLKTDADGRFRWDDAPPDAVLINVSRAGFAGITQQSVSAEQKELTLILKRSLLISGQIKDAITDEPIVQTDVEVGVPDATTGEIVWTRDQTMFTFQGRLQGNIDVENKPGVRLRIRAIGYEPAVSRVFRREENQVEYDVKLKKAD